MSEVSSVTESYRKVPYDIRTAKQIERRMLLESLQLLAEGGFPISEYQYTGFGSIHFVDFILLHRFLGITRMLCAEHSLKIKKRMEFNRPFKTVDVRMKSATEVIPTLASQSKHILWLDYDGPVERAHLDDLALAGTYLSSGSILAVTIDVEAPGDDSDGAREWRDYFVNQAGPLVGDATEIQDYAESLLIRRNIEILERSIASGLAGRKGIQFLPLYCFWYADGHEMLTLGGMVADANDAKKLHESKVPNLFYIRRDFKREPYRISPPVLTRKERLYLDAFMPCALGYTPSDFELPSDEVAAYRELYRYCPLYAELLI